MQAENTLMWKEILEEPAALRSCEAGNGRMIERIASETRKRGIRHVTVCARGTSDNAATYGKYAFEILTGMQVASAAPSVLTLYGRSVEWKDSLVIGISQSGQTEDVSRIIKAARQQGALTVGITNTAGSLLAESAEYVLFCSAGPEKSVAATKTFLAEMYLMVRMAAVLAEDREVLAQLSALPAGLDRISGLAGAAGNAAQRYRFVKECFVLARGLNYPVALEAALKIQETTYIGAKAFAISDFYHGPKAMVQEDTALLVFAPAGPSFEEAVGFIDQMRDTGADLLVVSDDEELCKRADAALYLPCSGSDFITPFYNAAAVQMLACQLATVRGNNPDKPRGLQKIVEVH